MSDSALIEGLLFKGFVKSSKDFKIIYEINHLFSADMIIKNE